MVDYEIFKGDTESWNIIIKSDNVAQNLNGYKFYLTVKDSISDADIDAAIQKITTVSTDITSVTLTINSNDTANLSVTSSTIRYLYDIRMIDSNGYPKVLVSGELKIKDPVTKSTS